MKPPPPRTLSLCLIVRDEAELLPACLESAAFADEVVVVDTGSTDETVAIAQAAGAHVVHFPWVDDFSAARNVGIEVATSDFILVLDADERLRTPDAVRALMAAEPSDAPPTVYLPLIANVDAAGASLGADYMPRLWRRRDTLRFSGRVHEQIGVGVEGLRRDYVDTFVIEHLGYDPVLAEARGKRVRNMTLLKAGLQERPDDLALAFYLAKEHYAAGDDDAAYEGFKRVAEDGGIVNFALSARVFGGECLRALGRDEEALRFAEAGLSTTPDYGVLAFVAGQAAAALGSLDTAATHFERARRPPQGLSAIAFQDPTVSGHRATLALAQVRVAQEAPEAAWALLSVHLDDHASEATPTLLAFLELYARAASSADALAFADDVVRAHPRLAQVPALLLGLADLASIGGVLQAQRDWLTRLAHLSQTHT